VNERRGKGNNWYRGRHVAPEEVATAFNISRSELPYQYGTGAVQPGPGSASNSALWTLTGILVAALLFMQLVLTARTTSVLSQTIQVEADTAATATPGTGRVLVSPSFTLAHQTALDIELNATLANHIEFYSGVEGGESWSEGSRSADAVLSRVPAGRYHLNFYPFTEKGVAPEIRVNVWADPALPSNFFIVLALILLVPCLQLLRGHLHERSRWENSDYNPYATEE
jgi:hypothetical protein